MRDNSVSIHLVGETIDAKQAHLRAQAGDLIPLIRGVYVVRGVDVDQTVMAHAMRIAHYIYPSAYLSSATASLLAPTEDGRLFISGRRNQRTRLRGLEIVQILAPAHPSTAQAVIGDDLGELRVQVSSPRQRFLEAFRLRSEHATAVTGDMRRQMAVRLIEEHGSPTAAADAIWTLARENGWYREGEGAERFLMTRPNTTNPQVNKAVFDLLVAWHGEPLGQLSHNGFEWRWKPQKGRGPVLVRETTPGKLPAFVESLLPEGWLAQVLHDRDERDALRRGRRYMSNITIAESRAELAALSADILMTPLASFADAGRFTGRYAGFARQDIEETFEQNLARVFSRAETPRLSGVQIKAPMSLSADGTVVPAIDQPFTHILKPAGTGGFATLPIVEWLCLELGRMAGFDVPDAALVEMPEGMPPALLVERFDIKCGPEDMRRFALEDFCSILDMPAAAKYDGTIERMAKGLRPLSADPTTDLAILFRRAIFAWLVADGDMHLKNLALLKIAEPGAKTFTSVRFAPLYDAVTTRVFPGLASDRMALKLNGKDDRLTKADFLTLARTIGLAGGHAEAILTDIATRLAAGAAALHVPDMVTHSQLSENAQDSVVAIVIERSVRFTT